MTEEGRRKTVNGTRCQEWKLDIKIPLSCPQFND
jgi:hypothetical protein